jgi:hypothetical protein
MFDTERPGSAPGSIIPIPDAPAPVPDAPAPLERLEAQICELAGHLTAATCRFLILLADFDARRGWASWDMNSCATWLSWKCQMSSGTAREHVRVARALRDLPVIRAEFGAARLSSSLADALLTVAEAFLAGKVAAADDPEVYQVIVHVGTDAAGVPAQTGGVSAETSAPARPEPGRPADPARCHVDDGPAVSVSTAQMITCTAHGGRTSLDNLISLCKYHHMLVHDRGYLIAAKPGGAFAFFRPDGTGIPPSPALPSPDGTIGTCHDADITPDTIIPPWYGERLNLDDAIYACLANARTPQERREQRDQANDPELFRPSKWVVEPADWIRYIREHTAA